MLKRKRNLLSIGILLLITIATITASLWSQTSPSFIDPTLRLLSPSSEHWFGTDHFGRDIFIRTIYAARVSLIVGAVVAVVATFLGTFTGLIAGYYKRADSIIMRIVDGMLAFPALILALALVAALGGSVANIIIALGFAFWPIMTRIVRAAVLQVKNVQYIEAAKTTGASDFVILTTYILPNILSPIIVQGTFTFARAILAEAALSFLGIGVNPTTPTWGNMLQEAQIYISMAPWFSIFPGLGIVLTVLALNMLGDGIRDAFDPHAKKQLKKRKKVSQQKYA
ncbi:ABC transporter permease [Psychrobacillus lasiicapitis]|uniref:ABC transporter permease n=1 Tax=Psychrobacillus lasiicapitis TaxID=1636719 RepID=A0A544SX02_9BACI|nr:ABC transporter permease [Psychrobacillus lasiicapitis]TQR09715.1 ABC transporter permease [Psychrobacillus lasiicapitis]GGA22942.1 peptide ABC transporter permease [Psychrobacillus lasiicapitis]